MRIDGKLTKWNDDRGFGFIEPTQGGQEIFVHISSFPENSQRPKLNELLSFEVEINKDGKKHAVRVQYPATRQQKNFANSRPNHQKPRGSSHTIVKLIFVVALVAYGYEKFNAYSSTKIVNVPEEEIQQTPSYVLTPPIVTRAEPVPPPVVMQCDGRTHCNQMKSCDEAMFFHHTCPGTKMDGDRDGIPCELEHCGH